MNVRTPNQKSTVLESYGLDPSNESEVLMVAKVVNGIPTIEIREASQGFATCMICRSAIRQSDRFVVCPKCRHWAHTTHLQEWLKVEGFCPVCKEKVAIHAISDNNPIERIKITLQEANSLLNAIQTSSDSQTIVALINDEIAGLLDYTPLRKVAFIRPISAAQKRFLIKYWREKYDIDLVQHDSYDNWIYEIGLIFDTRNGEKNYSYPSFIMDFYIVLE